MAEKTGIDENEIFAADDAANLNETENQTDEDATDETEQIREQIEETRNRLGDTIDAIQEKLSLSNITEQVTEQVTEQAAKVYETAIHSAYDATIGKAGKFMSKLNKELERSDIINKIGKNPFPLVLISIGAGLLFFSNKQKSRNGYNSRNNRAPNRNRQSEVNDKTSFVSSARNTLSDAASSAYESAGNAANSAYESVSGAASGTMQKFGEFGNQAKDQYDHYLSEKPLMIGAVAFAAGAILGLAIPETQYENQIAGQARENLISKVKDSVGETVDKVKNIAEQAKNTVGEEAKNQGLA